MRSATNLLTAPFLRGSQDRPARLPLPDLSISFLVLLLLAWLGVFWLDLPPAYPLLTTLLYGGLALIIGYGWLRCTAAARPARGFGWANRITLWRALPVLLISALVPFPDIVSDHGWTLAGVSLGALMMDGVDGKVARATGSGSAFGARFDMELDAFFILVLTLILLALGKAGPWILALGLIRYGFVLAAYAWPWIGRPLPESFRRKTVCVWQVVTLLVCLLPPVSAGFATVVLALGLGLLILSFVIDLRWLFQRRHGPA